MQHLIEELVEEANVAADGSTFVQQLRRKRTGSDYIPEEDEGPPSSVLEAVQHTLMLQTDALLCVLGCPIALKVWKLELVCMCCVDAMPGPTSTPVQL